MEQAIIVDTDNQQLTPGPVSFARIPVAGDYIRLGGTNLHVSGVLFDVQGPAARAVVKVIPPSTAA